MKSYEVRYLISEPAYVPYLITSLYSLRRYFDGPVAVYAFPESIESVKRVADDGRPSISVRLWHRKQLDEKANKDPLLAKHYKCHELSRIEIMADGPATGIPVIYLDADTIIMDSINGLADMLNDKISFVATQLDHWLVSEQPYRFLHLAGTGYDIRRLEEFVSKPNPALNSGVFACRTNSKILKPWAELSWQFRGRNTPCELALNLLQDLDGFTVARGGIYNANAKRWRARHRSIKIVHGIGNIFRRRPWAPAHFLWKETENAARRINWGNSNFMDDCYKSLSILETRGKKRRAYLRDRRLRKNDLIGTIIYENE